jgi:CRP-like cAMP-binding protein
MHYYLIGLFDSAPDKSDYIKALIHRYGITPKAGDFIFELGNTERNLYYLVDGEVNLTIEDEVVRKITTGQYFGETTSLAEQPAVMNAVVISPEACNIVIYGENIDAMLKDSPDIAMRLLKQLTSRLENSRN